MSLQFLTWRSVVDINPKIKCIGLLPLVDFFQAFKLWCGALVCQPREPFCSRPVRPWWIIGFYGLRLVCCQLSSASCRVDWCPGDCLAGLWYSLSRPRLSEMNFKALAWSWRINSVWSAFICCPPAGGGASSSRSEKTLMTVRSQLKPSRFWELKSSGTCLESTPFGNQTPNVFPKSLFLFFKSSSRSVHSDVRNWLKENLKMTPGDKAAAFLCQFLMTVHLSLLHLCLKRINHLFIPFW